jgi:hypothetical protein
MEKEQMSIRWPVLAALAMVGTLQSVAAASPVTVDESGNLCEGTQCQEVKVPIEESGQFETRTVMESAGGSGSAPASGDAVDCGALGCSTVEVLFGFTSSAGGDAYRWASRFLLDPAQLAQPSTLLLIGSGLLGAGVVLRRRFRHFRRFRR